MGSYPTGIFPWVWVDDDSELNATGAIGRPKDETSRAEVASLCEQLAFSRFKAGL